jgi:hypothetical protein
MKKTDPKAAKTAAKPAAKTAGSKAVKTATLAKKTTPAPKGGGTGTKTGGGTKTTPKTGENPKSKFKYYNQLSSSDSTMMASKATDALKQFKGETMYVKNPSVAKGEAGIRADRTYTGTDPQTGKQYKGISAANKKNFPGVKTWKEGKPRMATFRGSFK